MEICRLDAWYSSKEGSLEDPATYIVWGLCRRCCLPELILRCMQVGFFTARSLLFTNAFKSFDYNIIFETILSLILLQVSISLAELGNQTENHDELIELVACSETGFLHLFSQQQLQVSK